jgi:hypothetical protein
MSEQALAFGLMALFLFFVALTVSGLDVGTCRQCEHCQDLRRREEQRREAIRMELDARYRPRPQRADQLARRHAALREQRERMSRSSDQVDRRGD